MKLRLCTEKPHPETHAGSRRSIDELPGPKAVFSCFSALVSTTGLSGSML